MSGATPPEEESLTAFEGVGSVLGSSATPVIDLVWACEPAKGTGAETAAAARPEGAADRRGTDQAAAAAPWDPATSRPVTSPPPRPWASISLPSAPPPASTRRRLRSSRRARARSNDLAANERCRRRPIPLPRLLTLDVVPVGSQEAVAVARASAKGHDPSIVSQPARLLEKFRRVGVRFRSAQSQSSATLGARQGTGDLIPLGTAKVIA